MKVRLTQKGELRIKADTELESYALKKWCDDNLQGQTVSGANILIDMNVAEVRQA